MNAHSGTVSIFRKHINLQFSFCPPKMTYCLLVFREWNCTLEIDCVQRCSYLLELLEAIPEWFPKVGYIYSFFPNHDSITMHSVILTMLCEILATQLIFQCTIWLQ
jgi:hypothetical protein